MLVQATQKAMYKGDWKVKGQQFTVDDDTTARGYLKRGVIIPVDQPPVEAKVLEAVAAEEPKSTSVTPRPRLRDQDTDESTQPRRRYNRRDLEPKE